MSASLTPLRCTNVVGKLDQTRAFSRVLSYLAAVCCAAVSVSRNALVAVTTAAVLVAVEGSLVQLATPAVEPSLLVLPSLVVPPASLVVVPASDSVFPPSSSEHATKAAAIVSPALPISSSSRSSRHQLDCLRAMSASL